MASALRLAALALTLTVLSCGSNDDPAQTGGSAGTTGDGAATLPKCPDEQDLTPALPCDCYGHEANATTIVDPTCQTRVVCCPTISNLRCEDHENLDAGNSDSATDSAATDAGTQADADAAAAKCPNEVDLSTATLPCDCYGTLVADPKQAMPTCTTTVVCCPGEQALKCE